MKLINSIKSLEYLSLSLILSFIFLHKLILLFCGMIISLLLINKTSIVTISRKISIYKHLKEVLNNKIFDIMKNKDIEIKDNPEVELAEIVELSGFIPLKNQEKNNDVA